MENKNILCPKCNKNVLFFTTAETKSGAVQVVKIQCIPPGLLGDLHKAGVSFFNDPSVCRFPIDSPLFGWLVEKYLRIEQYQKDKENAENKANKELGEKLVKIKEEYEKRMDELEYFIQNAVDHEKIK